MDLVKKRNINYRRNTFFLLVIQDKNNYNLYMIGDNPDDAIPADNFLLIPEEGFTDLSDQYEKQQIQLFKEKNINNLFINKEKAVKLANTIIIYKLILQLYRQSLLRFNTDKFSTLLCKIAKQLLLNKMTKNIMDEIINCIQRTDNSNDISSCVFDKYRKKFFIAISCVPAKPSQRISDLFKEPYPYFITKIMSENNVSPIKENFIHILIIKSTPDFSIGFTILPKGFDLFSEKASAEKEKGKNMFCFSLEVLGNLQGDSFALMMIDAYQKYNISFDPAISNNFPKENIPEMESTTGSADWLDNGEPVLKNHRTTEFVGTWEELITIINDAKQQEQEVFASTIFKLKKQYPLETGFYLLTHSFFESGKYISLPFGKNYKQLIRNALKYRQQYKSSDPVLCNLHGTDAYQTSRYEIRPDRQVGRNSSLYSDSIIISVAACIKGQKVTCHQEIAQKAFEVIQYYAMIPLLRFFFTLPFIQEIEEQKLSYTKIDQLTLIIYSSIENLIFELYDQLKEGELIFDATIENHIKGLI